MTKLCTILFALALSACANESTLLHSDNGGSRECRAYGGGLIGYPVAKLSYEHCLKVAKQDGYK
jgi:hypothetical protein